MPCVRIRANAGIKGVLFFRRREGRERGEVVSISGVSIGGKAGVFEALLAVACHYTNEKCTAAAAR